MRNKDTTFEALLAAGRRLGKKKMENDLRSLAADPRFPAVLAWLDGNRESFEAASCSQQLAAHHGPLAHAGGSLYGVRILLGQLRKLVAPPPPEVAMGQPEE